MQSSKLKYAIPGIPALLLAIAWLGEQYITKWFGAAWSDFSWGWALLVAVGILAGMIYADFCMPDSGLRRWMRSRARLFEVDHVGLAHRTEDGRSWYEAMCGLRFLKLTEDVSLSVRVTQYVDASHAKRSFVVSKERIGEVEQDLHKKIVMARFPQRVSKDVPPGYPTWGESEAYTWAGDGQHVVTVTARAGIKRQQVRFLFVCIRDVGGGPEPAILLGGPNTRGYVKVVEQ